MAWASIQAICGIVLGLVVGAQFEVGTVIGAAAQKLVGYYELAAPVLVFSILGPSILRLLRHERAELQRFSVFAVAWFSLLRLCVCVVAALVIALIYGLPLGTGPSPATSTPINREFLLSLAENRYLATFGLACLCAYLLRNLDGPWVDRFLRLPDAIEAAGNFLTRLTAPFGFLVGVYIISLPDILLTSSRQIGDAALQPLVFGWFQFETSTASGLMSAYLAVSALTAGLCLALHGTLVAWARLRIPGFTIRGYLQGYLLRVYPLIWSTGAESLAIPTNLATLRRYGRGIPDALRDLTVGLAATLNLNGSLICSLVLVPAVCATIGHPLPLAAFLACLPVVFVLGYAIPGIPGELIVFADPLAQALGISGGERDLFLLLFLGWQIGLTDAFRSAGSATDAVPSTLLLTNAYRRRYGVATMQEAVLSGNPSIRLSSNSAVIAGDNFTEGGRGGG
jgi:Na+/H+-dicarboxylate symporter